MSSYMIAQNGEYVDSRGKKVIATNFFLGMVTFKDIAPFSPERKIPVEEFVIRYEKVEGQ